jgi:hypothetical protein
MIAFIGATHIAHLAPRRKRRRVKQSGAGETVIQRSFDQAAHCAPPLTKLIFRAARLRNVIIY